MITISNLNFKYLNPLFQELNLTVESGRIVGLLGKNGAGKTSLLKIICGMIQPLSGEISVLNQQPRLHKPAFLQNIFFLSEHAEPPNLDPVNMVKICGEFFPAFNKEQYFYLLNKLEVPLNRKPSTLSFGQKRKALLAFALATNTELLILDEPTNGFDISAQVTLRQLLLECRNPEKTIIISTHHIREFETILDDVVILENGCIVLHQTKEILQMENNGTLDLEKVFLQNV